MSYYTAPFTFDFISSCINIDTGVVTIDCQGLYTAIKDAQASQEGIIYEPIGRASGLQDLGGGILVGITVELLGDWQLCFPTGNYIAKVSGGNLIGGPGGDPIAYSAGVQTLLIQSAASTVVTTSGGGSTDWTSGERAQIRSALGINGAKTTATGGQLQSLPTDTANAVRTELTPELDNMDAKISSRLDLGKFIAFKFL